MRGSARLLLGLVCAIAPAGATTYLVTPDGTGDFPTIQAAVDAVLDGDVIELGSGTFRGTGNVEVSFLGKAITVGSQADDPDSCWIDCEDGTRGFLFTAGEDSTSILRTVTITGGYTSERGGGVFCQDACPRIIGCRFTDNAAGSGGALACYHNAAPWLQDCDFDQNTAATGGAAFCDFYSSPAFEQCRFEQCEAPVGGAIACRNYSSPALSDCVFESNAADVGGAVQAHHGSRPDLTACAFLSNTAAERGGALAAHEYAWLTLHDCSFTGNSAGIAGGAVCGFAHGFVTEAADCIFLDNSAAEGGAVSGDQFEGMFANCTFAGNVASTGGALSCRQSVLELSGATLYDNHGPNGAGLNTFDSVVAIQNTVLAFNTGGRAIECLEPPTLGCCDIFGNQGGDWVGPIADQFGIQGNIDLDPLFCNATQGDYTLHENSPCAPFSPPNAECDRIGAWDVGCGPAQRACCVGEECTLLSQSECNLAGGVWLPETMSCDPNPCLPGPAYACCVETECLLLPEIECIATGGVWWSGVASCDPDPCRGRVFLLAPDGGDFPTIQAALDVALDHDLILLADGIYTGPGNRDLDYLGRSVRVYSHSMDPQACIIDCEGSAADPHRGACFHLHEDSTAVLAGVAIRNGYKTDHVEWEATGGAIRCTGGASPTILNCRFEDNFGDWGGGAIRCREGSAPTLIDCVFVGNETTDEGGAIMATGTSAPRIERCTFQENVAARGGAVSCAGNCSPLIRDCTFLENTAQNGSALLCRVESSPTVANCTFHANYYTAVNSEYQCFPHFEHTIIAFTQAGRAVLCYSTGGAYLSCCDVYGNSGGDWLGCIAGQYGIDGNISADPLFCDPGAGNLRLQPESPCAPFSPPNPECDLIGAWPVGCDPQMVVSEPQLDKDPCGLRLVCVSPTQSPARLLLGIPSGNGPTVVRVEIFDLGGRLVRSLAHEVLSPGCHTFAWNGRDRGAKACESGIYFARVEAGTRHLVRRIALIR